MTTLRIDITVPDDIPESPALDNAVAMATLNARQALATTNSSRPT